MLALSVRQPWAWCILHGQKRIENRTWPLPRNLIGRRILLHASSGCTQVEYDEAAAFIRRTLGYNPPPLRALPRGALVGAFTLNGCASPEASTDPWHVPGKYGFRLSRVWALDEPIPCKGALKFFSVPDEVANEVRKYRVEEQRTPWKKKLGS